MSTLHHIIYSLNDVFEELALNIEPATLEEITIIIYKSMTGQTRNFHTLEHIFGLAETKNPVHTLAAFFHDLVYYQVDGGFLPEVWTLIGPYLNVTSESGDVHVAANIPPDDHLVHLTLDIFGFKLGQQLSPFAGLNEFLSALAMNKQLAKLVPDQDLAKMTACIEATIPFRGRDEVGKNCFDHLETRLQQVNRKFRLKLKPSQIQAIIKSAVLFANKDVKNFATDDPAYFLDKTWKLLPELNQPLQTGDFYSIKEFRQALQKMAGFFDFLNPDHIFHQYRAVPPDDVFRHMVASARQNIEMARTYLNLKLLPLVILEALADLSGGDAPLALFMGDVRQEDEPSVRWEDYLLPAETYIRRDESSTLYHLLNVGRTSEAGFDMKNSPMAAFLHKNLDNAALAHLQGQAKKFIAREISPQVFLQEVPRPTLSAIIQACSVTAVTRRDRLRQLLPEG